MEAFKNISRAGFEVEGGWNYRPRLPMKGDGSVSGVSGDRGEIASPPYDDYEILCKDLEENYPSDCNKSCGFHIHVSFQSIHDYGLLMEKGFFDFFQEKMKAWGKNYPCKNKEFWDRLNGGNTYCAKTFNPEEQISGRSGERYTQLNFCAYLRHKTVECRLLPMFKQKDTAKSALKQVLSIFDDWITQQKKQEPKTIISEQTVEELDLVVINL